MLVMIHFNSQKLSGILDILDLYCDYDRELLVKDLYRSLPYMRYPYVPFYLKRKDDLLRCRVVIRPLKNSSWSLNICN